MAERTFQFAARDAVHVDVLSVDGHDVRHAVRGFTFRYGVGCAPQLTLDLVVCDATGVDSERVEVVMPQATRDLLIEAGWTPPVGTEGNAGGHGEEVGRG